MHALHRVAPVPCWARVLGKGGATAERRAAHGCKVRQAAAVGLHGPLELAVEGVAVLKMFLVLGELLVRLQDCLAATPAGSGPVLRADAPAPGGAAAHQALAFGHSAQTLPRAPGHRVEAGAGRGSWWQPARTSCERSARWARIPQTAHLEPWLPSRAGPSTCGRQQQGGPRYRPGRCRARPACAASSLHGQRCKPSARKLQPVERPEASIACVGC